MFYFAKPAINGVRYRPRSHRSGSRLL